MLRDPGVELFTRTPGITEPWYVEKVKFSHEERRLDVHLNFREGEVPPPCVWRRELRGVRYQRKNLAPFRLLSVCYIPAWQTAEGMVP